MTKELIIACIDWVNEDKSRSMKFEFSNCFGEPPKMFLYDYDLQYGYIVINPDDLLTTEQMREEAKKNILKRVARLEGQSCLKHQK